MSSMEVLKLFKTMLRESKKIPSYNFREYALRRIRDGFKQNKVLSNQKDIQTVIQNGLLNLEIIKRQVIVGHMYSTEKLVIEYTQQKN